ncbi:MULTISPECIES: SCO family protein [Limnochorda]|uniref:SCO family protein n=1 Tax=Limnochorda TaxID=1676651 RepID=UPI001D7CC524|nr:SCO family protein [Limnochorda pilosa]MBO2486801.1 SCO family protein [Bacillota bacterium]
MPARRRMLVEIALVIVIAVAGVTWAYTSRPAPAFHGRLLEPLREAPVFSLTDHQGEPFHLADQRGKAVLLFFGYTTCPDVCPATLGTLGQMKRQLGADGERVEVVFITVDPERDTPARLAEYLGYFDPSAIGLTGPPEELARVREAYGVYAERVNDPQAPGGYWMNHTATVLLIDPEGRLRLSYTFGSAPAEIAEDVRRILRG